MNKSSSSGEMEGSWVSFYCHDNRNEPVNATCMKNGSWSPDPHTYKCKERNLPPDELDSNSSMATWHVIAVIIIAFIAVVLLVIIGAVIMQTGTKDRKLKIMLSHFK